MDIQAFDKTMTKLLGKANVLDQGLEKYEKGWRYGAGKALRVVRPEKVAQVAEILKYCHEARIPVVAQGGNTGLVGASVPDASGQQIVLSLERMRRIVEVDTANRTVQAEAGVVLDVLNERLEEFGLWLPVDIGAGGSATIGGMISTNAAGTRRGKYGDMRHQVRSLTVVLANGQVLTLGGTLVQDNGHMPLKELFIGTGGSLGIVVEATLALKARPLQSETVVMVPARDKAIWEIYETLMAQFGDRFSAFEMMGDNAVQLVAKHHQDIPYLFAGDTAKKPAQDVVLLAEVVSTQDAEVHSVKEELEACLLQLLEQGLISTARSDKPALFWQVRHHISESIGREGVVIAFDIAVDAADLPKFRRKMDAVIEKTWPKAKVYAFGHEMIGACHYDVVWPKEAGELTAEIKEAIRDKVYHMVAEEFKGTFSAEHGIGPHNREYYRRFTSEGERTLANAVKKALDPEGILNPNVDFG